MEFTDRQDWFERHQRFFVFVLGKWSVNSRNCLNPKGEFCGCSGMSLRTTEKYLQKAKARPVYRYFGKFEFLAGFVK